ncbi:restriction endonuclease subunit S [Shewanella livingstonensis]|uniref:Restriction endonuclease subunit S n=1 Tax=Shewanella livingstonensis TaxID=150120 RepID=A0A3G8LSL8_9GAMM|nr:restriction endonuclease subunit S [Shewanella livingstonensis]AZG71748.1 restriction endonuclease subunit S [Shewanella livingstonensis]
MSELKAGKYQAYSEYRDSKIGWLERVPSHWIEGSVKYICKSLDYKRIPLSAEERGSRQGEYPYYGASGVIDRVDDYLFDEDTILFGEDGANLLAKSTPLAFIASGKYWVNNHAHILKPLDEMYSFWVNSLNNLDISPVVSGSAQPKLTAEALGNLEVVYPPNVEERQKITNFLDHETAKIDTLIDKQQQLIKLLKEKRQAVISHAVTKGISNKEHPQAPMKDSGVEWLGEVPAHWVVTKLKYLSSIQGGYAFSSDSFTEEGVQILRIGNVYQNRLALERQPIFVPNKMLNELSDFKVQQNDILMSLTGTLGKRDYGFAIKVEHCDYFLLNQRVAKLLPFDAKVDVDFLINVLWSESYLTQLYSLPSGTKQANLANSDVLGIVVAIPPTKEEQRAIANYLSQKLEYFDRTIEKAQNAILLMQERRTALISAAVTGKIDVRHWEPPHD